jgi:hypothetical protein
MAEGEELNPFNPFNPWSTYWPLRHHDFLRGLSASVSTMMVSGVR